VGVLVFLALRREGKVKRSGSRHRCPVAMAGDECASILKKKYRRRGAPRKNPWAPEVKHIVERHRL